MLGNVSNIFDYFPEHNLLNTFLLQYAELLADERILGDELLSLSSVFAVGVLTV